MPDQLRGLEAGVVGHRMPPAAVVLAHADWAPDRVDRFCRACGVTLATFESDDDGCADCVGAHSRSRRAARSDEDRIAAVVRLGRYSPPLSRWLPAIKQRAWRDMGVALGRSLGRQVRDAVMAGRSPMPTCVVPVPVHWTRRLLRGIDHAQTIADAAASELALPCIRALRARLSSRQVGSGSDGRRRNRGRFLAARRADLPEGAVVLLVDDVKTTGSTMREAIRGFEGRGVGAFVLGACAVVDPPRRASLHGNVDKF